MLSRMVQFETIVQTTCCILLTLFLCTDLMTSYKSYQFFRYGSCIWAGSTSRTSWASWTSWTWRKGTQCNWSFPRSRTQVDCPVLELTQKCSILACCGQLFFLQEWNDRSHLFSVTDPDLQLHSSRYCICSACSLQDPQVFPTSCGMHDVGQYRKLLNWRLAQRSRRRIGCKMVWRHGDIF